MQTITRANRVCSYIINSITKENGEIIDYYNVFRNMKKALASYALGGSRPGDKTNESLPVEEKDKLVVLLDEAIAQGLSFCRSHDIDLASLTREDNVFKNLSQFYDYADILLTRDEWRKEFIVYENTISALYEACKPEILSDPRILVAVFQYLRGVVDSRISDVDIEQVSLKIAELLDESVVANGEGFRQQEYGTEYKIVQQGKTWDLSQTNFDQLKTDFRQVKHKHIEIADLRRFLERKIEQMLQQNVTRTNFAQRFQAIVDQYNAGGSTTENYYEALVDFAKKLKEEEERHVREGLTVEELELFDLLQKDRMTAAEIQQVKLAAKSLLNRLQGQQPKVLVQDWHRDDQIKLRVKSVVEEVLDQNLPDTYTRMMFSEKCSRVFELIFNRASAG
jgi:type I restriction enzyme R subunit